MQEPQLDDLRFQDLVDEARKRIITYCPEWTDYNLSDPGITLIELFAWMTDMLGYRLNQVPAKNYFKFLELLGTKPGPPQQAKTELTFYLSTRFPLTRADGQLDYDTQTTVPKDTEVATRRSTGADEEIIFTTDNDLLIASPRLRHLRRDVDNDFSSNYLQEKQQGDDLRYEVRYEGFLAFAHSPQAEDAFYLGFNESLDISGYLLQLQIEMVRDEAPEGTGINPDKPPLHWEAYTKNGWAEVELDKDSTKGLNVQGEIILHLPLAMRRYELHGVRTYWLRCVHKPEEHNRYTAPPHIKTLQVYVLGASIKATHSAPVPAEALGRSNGDPGQTFSLSTAPILPLDAERGEFIQIEVTPVQEGQEPVYENWTSTADFSLSDEFDKHYTLDIGTGEISFGPNVRQPDGLARQYGRIPPLNRRIRISRYRTGGGAKGNVPRRSLRVLKKSVSYIVDVTNRQPALGGLDSEDIDAAKLRAQASLRTQHRAVTAEDYETICQDLSYIARIKCQAATVDGLSPRPGVVKLLIVPEPTLIEGSASEIEQKSENEAEQVKLKRYLEKLEAYQFLANLALERNLKEQLHLDLEPHRMLGIILEIETPPYRVVKIDMDIQCYAYHKEEDVRQAVVQVLKQFITPLNRGDEQAGLNQAMAVISSNGQPQPKNGEASSPGSQVWPYGRHLYLSDIYAQVQALPGVEHIKAVKMWWCDMTPEQAKAVVTQLKQDKESTPTALNWHLAQEGMVPTPAGGLLYLLETEDIVVTKSQGRE